MLRSAVLVLATCISLVAGLPQDAAVQKESDRIHAPGTLAVKGKVPLFMARGEGVQIYAAEADKEGKPQWILKAPRATLLDYKTGTQVGTHAAGPTWVDNDGGKLTGTGKPLAKEPAPNADAVPWLLLEVKAENGGRFAKVRNIQRLDTWGGNAPTVPPEKSGETKEVRYEATYVFWGDK